VSTRAVPPTARPGHRPGRPAGAPLQLRLGGTDRPALTGAPVTRRHLDGASWVDLARGFLTGADTLLGELITAVPWRQGRRRMWDRIVDDPRLSRWYRPGEPAPHPVLEEVRAALEARYGVPLAGPACNLYRDGQDSVAPHRDRELVRLDDTIVAILTLGARRPFHLRPVGGGRSIDLAPASGDLLVMGGACQRDWEHAVPKVARSAPRLSVSWRWSARAHS
jgi:alkylated DNA repair dioxygenase AlkB